MNNVLYTSLIRYFSALSNLGYISYNEVTKLLFITIVQELIYKDFMGIITEDDYREIEKALYKIFGTSCLVPFPNYCNNTDMNKLHLGDISELAYRIDYNKQAIEEIKNIKVVKTTSPYEEDVEDIIPQ